ncbi:suppressor of kinetochore protein mutant [Entomophthora muscae]|uniref:Suppressor of kinetochore protein mutant n=1 Tax=Entomophthora muscae TaxID=34485 RepID=A0ACC2RPB4_9FUNG|nr:suppressor of kinetochore protein mutant [Entomophthora muscae]
MIQAAEALELTELLNFSCKALAEWMKDRSVQEVRDQLNFESDFKPLDEPMHAKEMLWITKQ